MRREASRWAPSDTRRKCTQYPTSISHAPSGAAPRAPQGCGRGQSHPQCATSLPPSADGSIPNKAPIRFASFDIRCDFALGMGHAATFCLPLTSLVHAPANHSTPRTMGVLGAEPPGLTPAEHQTTVMKKQNTKEARRHKKSGEYYVLVAHSVGWHRPQWSTARPRGTH